MDVGSIPTTPTNLERNEMQTFVIEYTSCEGNFRWMTIEAESVFEAEDMAITGSDVGGDGIAEILTIYET